MKWNFLALILKNSYISRNKTLHFSASTLEIFPKKNSEKARSEKFLIFSYISRNEILPFSV